MNSYPDLFSFVFPFGPWPHWQNSGVGNKWVKITGHGHGNSNWFEVYWSHLLELQIWFMETNMPNSLKLISCFLEIKAYPGGQVTSMIEIWGHIFITQSIQKKISTNINGITVVVFFPISLGVIYSEWGYAQTPLANMNDVRSSPDIFYSTATPDKHIRGRSMKAFLDRRFGNGEKLLSENWLHGFFAK